MLSDTYFEKEKEINQKSATEFRKIANYAFIQQPFHLCQHCKYMYVCVFFIF